MLQNTPESIAVRENDLHASSNTLGDRILANRRAARFRRFSAALTSIVPAIPSIRRGAETEATTSEPTPVS